MVIDPSGFQTFKVSENFLQEMFFPATGVQGKAARSHPGGLKSSTLERPHPWTGNPTICAVHPYMKTDAARGLHMSRPSNSADVQKMLNFLNLSVARPECRAGFQDKLARPRMR